jgi:hypothetical protein
MILAGLFLLPLLTIKNYNKWIKSIHLRPRR